VFFQTRILPVPRDNLETVRDRMYISIIHTLLHLPFHYLHIGVFTWMSCSELKLHWSLTQCFYFVESWHKEAFKEYEEEELFTNRKSYTQQRAATSAIAGLLLIFYSDVWC